MSNAARAIERADELASLIDNALDEAKNATIEYEAIKLMSERLVSDVKKEYEEKFNAMKQMTDVEKNELTDLFLEQQSTMQDDFEREINDMKHELQQEKMNMTSKLHHVQEQAELDIQSIQEKMNLLQERTKEDVQFQKDTATKEILKIQKQSKDDLEQLTNETNALIQMTKDEAQATISKVQSEMNTLMEVSTAEKMKLKKEHDTILTKVKNDAAEELSLLRTELLQMITDTEERAARIERQAEYQISDTRKEAETLVHDTRKAAKLEFERLNKEAAEALEKQHEQFNKRYEQLDQEYFEYRRKAVKKESELEADVELKMKSIVEYKKVIEETTDELNGMEMEMMYWKSLHDSQTYVNSTLIYTDTIEFMDKSVSYVEEHVNHAVHVVYNEIKTYSKSMQTSIVTVIQPYELKLRDFYVEHLQVIVDDTIMPFYLKHILPWMERMEKKASPMIMSIAKESEVQYSRVESYLTSTYHESCDVLNIKIGMLKKTLVDGSAIAHGQGNRNGHVYYVVTDFIISMLDMVEEDTEAFVMMTMKGMAGLSLYMMRYMILSMILWIVVLPFRISWYFCPLRLIVRAVNGGSAGKSGMTKAVASEMAADELKNGKKNKNNKNNMKEKHVNGVKMERD